MKAYSLMLHTCDLGKKMPRPTSETSIRAGENRVYWPECAGAFLTFQQYFVHFKIKRTNFHKKLFRAACS